METYDHGRVQLEYYLYYSFERFHCIELHVRRLMVACSLLFEQQPAIEAYILQTSKIIDGSHRNDRAKHKSISSAFDKWPYVKVEWIIWPLHLRSLLFLCDGF